MWTTARDELVRVLSTLCDRPGDEWPVVVSTKPEEITPALTDGRLAILINPPRIETEGNVLNLEFEVPVIAPSIEGDYDTDLARLMSDIDTLVHIDSARPISWTGAQSTDYPAYLLTVTMITGRTRP